MNKNIVIVIGILIILGLGGFFVLSKRSPGNSSTQPVVTSSDQGGEVSTASGPTSLKDLIAKGVAETCNFSSDVSQGTVYISGGKVRGDFESTTDGKVTASHMIVDGNTSYIWMDGQTTGFKTTFNTQTPQPTTAVKTPAESFDASQSLNYDCKPGVASASLFTLPTGVNFMEFTGAPTGSFPSANTSPASGSNSSQCSYCNALQGDSKTQCLEALHCN